MFSHCAVRLHREPRWLTSSRLLWKVFESKITKDDLIQQPQLTEMNAGWLRGDGVQGSQKLLLTPPQLILQNPQGTKRHHLANYFLHETGL